MAAGNTVLRVRNGADTGWIDVEVGVLANAALRFDASKNPTVGGAPGGTPTTLATAGAGTYLAAAILTGIILRDPNGGNRTDTTDTAAAIIAAIPQLAVDYAEWTFIVVNTADAAETITVAGGTGVTTQGTMTIAQNSANKFSILRLSSSALVIRPV